MFVEASAKSTKRIKEAKWANKQLQKSELPYGIVAGIDLTKDIVPNLN